MVSEPERGNRRPRLGAVILAAGAGSRLGGVAKALLVTQGLTYLERIVGTARGKVVGLHDGVIVVGPPFAEAVAAHARTLGLRVAVNAEPERGMASSIAIGFATLASGDADAAWLWPVDHPGVEAATLRALVAALGSHQVARPRFESRGGHPPLVARSLWAQLASCTEMPDGARGVIAAADVVEVAVTDAAVVRDVDTRADAERIA